jgi:excisionase family DNA binding protein
VRNSKVRKAAELRLLTPREIAELINRRPWTVYRLIRSGDLPSVTIGGTLRVPAAAIQQLIDKALASAD